MRFSKNFMILLCFILTFSMYAYDYAWPVDYEIKNYEQIEINKIVETFLRDNSAFQVWELDWEKYRTTEKNKDKKNAFYRICIEQKEIIPFGICLSGNVYLEDVNVIVHFYLPNIAGTSKNYIRLVSFSNDFNKVNQQCRLKQWFNFFSFNDVEPTKQEIQIKESFEKNFLSKLPLEWEYKKPALLDRFLSKLLTLFRKRKKFVDKEL